MKRDALKAWFLYTSHWVNSNSVVGLSTGVHSTLVTS